MGEPAGTTGTPATASSATGWVEFDTTTIVQAQYAGTNHGFLIRDGAEDDASAQQHVYSSREGPTRRSSC
ncbi:MAG: DNRLRE domain-containing protein [Actinomycetota bacterium]|nr:DNRLRE domain-containing protein [Actinomycetota bacterium]